MLIHTVKKTLVNARRAFTGKDRLLMRKGAHLLNLTRDRIPWALARFNDGEIKAMAVANVGEKTARDDQEIDHMLVDRLNWAIRQRQENLWVGLPCSVCWPRERTIAEASIGKEYLYRTLAVVQTNRNWQEWIYRFAEVIKGREVTWVSGEDQNLLALNKKTGIVIKDQWRLPITDVWQKEYSELRERSGEFSQDEVVVLSCGPMATVLAVEWFQKRPDCTFVDMGSTFDPFTRDVWHRCHTQNLPRCLGCN